MSKRRGAISKSSYYKRLRNLKVKHLLLEIHDNIKKRGGKGKRPLGPAKESSNEDGRRLRAKERKKDRV